MAFPSFRDERIALHGARGEGQRGDLVVTVRVFEVPTAVSRRRVETVVKAYARRRDEDDPLPPKFAIAWDDLQPNAN